MVSSPPTVFPVWPLAADGVTPIQVYDLPSYNAALATGATYTAATPMTGISTGGGQTISVVQLPLNPGQTLPAADASVDAGVSC